MREDTLRSMRKAGKKAAIFCAGFAAAGSLQSSTPILAKAGWVGVAASLILTAVSDHFVREKENAISGSIYDGDLDSVLDEHSASELYGCDYRDDFEQFDAEPECEEDLVDCEDGMYDYD